MQALEAPFVVVFVNFLIDGCHEDVVDQRNAGRLSLLGGWAKLVLIGVVWESNPGPSGMQSGLQLPNR